MPSFLIINRFDVINNICYFDTGTISFSDIENKADYQVDSETVNIGIGTGLIPSVGAPSIYHNGDSASSTTKSAVEEGTLTVRDTANQQQNVDDLSRNTEDANNPLAQIFDKQQELDKIEQQQLINDIAAQMKDVANKYDRIQAQNDLADKKDQMLKDAEEQYADMSEDEKKLHGSAEEYANQTYYDAVTQQVNDNARKNIGGMGSDYSKGIDAATSVITGILTGNIAGGLAGATAPYLAEQIKSQTGHYDVDNKKWEMDNPNANLIAHAILGAVVAQLQGNSALAGAAGAAGGEAIAGIIRDSLYKDKTDEQLSESDKQNISNLSQLAAGLATALASGGDMGDTGTAVNAGKNAVENNYLGKVLIEGCALAAPCRNKVAEKVLEYGVKAGITAVVAKEIADNLSSDELDHLVMLNMMGNDDITSRYLGHLQDKYSSDAQAANDSSNNGNQGSNNQLITGGSVAAGGAGDPGDWEPDDKDKNNVNKDKNNQQNSNDFANYKDNLQKGDRVDLSKFNQRVSLTNKKGEYVDPKTGWRISPERSSSNPHGGSAWKLMDKAGNRIGTLNENGVFLRP